MRVKIKPVNDMAVCDEHLNIIILKKPKRSRYQSIQKRQGIISALSMVRAEIKGGRG